MTRDPSRRDLADARDASSLHPTVAARSGNPIVTTLRKTRTNTHAVALRALRPC